MAGDLLTPMNPFAPSPVLGNRPPIGHRRLDDPVRPYPGPGYSGARGEHTAARATAKRKQLRGSALGDRLVEIAAGLFYEHGVRAISVDEIVRRSGLAKASVYRRFPTKNDLVLAVLQQRDDDFWTRWDETAALHTDARAELDAHLTRLQELATPRCYRGCVFVNVAAEYGHAESGQIRQRCLEHERELARRLRALTVRIGVDDSDRLADQLHLAVVGAFAVAGIYPGGGPAGNLRAMADALLPKSPVHPEPAGYLAHGGAIGVG